MIFNDDFFINLNVFFVFFVLQGKFQFSIFVIKKIKKKIILKKNKNKKVTEKKTHTKIVCVFFFINVIYHFFIKKISLIKTLRLRLRKYILKNIKMSFF